MKNSSSTSPENAGEKRSYTPLEIAKIEARADFHFVRAAEFAKMAADIDLDLARRTLRESRAKVRDLSKQSPGS